MEYGVVDDYGDDWEEGYIVYKSSSLKDCLMWAEDSNYHSASIVEIYPDGSRKRIQ